MKHPYQHDCVSSTAEFVHYLRDREVQITRRTFVKNTNNPGRFIIENSLGYHRGFPITRDHHVTYWKSKLPNGKPVYYVSWSGIEYFFFS